MLAGTSSAACLRPQLTPTPSPPVQHWAEVAEEGQRGQLCATLLPAHPTRKNPRGHTAQAPACHSKQGLLGCSQGICSLQKGIPFDVQRHQQQCRRCCQPCTGVDGTARFHCQAHLSQSSLRKCFRAGSSLAAEEREWWTMLGCSSLRDRSLSSPAPGWRRSYVGAWPCSPTMPEGKTKRLQFFRDCILISGTSSAHKPPGRLLQPWTSMSNHFLIPAIPEQGDNEILKLLWRKSILWQKQLPQQSPGAADSPWHMPAYPNP